MDIQWNPQEEKALESLRKYVANPTTEPFVLAGLAGTGKTTVISAFMSERAPGSVALLAPTGKAAGVLNRKQTHTVAQTIHSFLYGAPHDANAALVEEIERLEGIVDAHNSGIDECPNIHDVKNSLQAAADKAARSISGKSELQFVMKDVGAILEGGQRLIVCDEASMVSPEEVTNLARLGLPVIYLGDPNQLYPVGYNKFAAPLDRPDALLTQIMRQGDGSPILELSRKIIEEQGMPRDVGDIPVMRGTNPFRALEFLEDEDAQVIVFKNDTRRELAAQIRIARFKDQFHKDYPFLPFIGEQLMVDSNKREFGVMKGYRHCR